MRNQEYKYEKVYTCSIDIVASTKTINEQGNVFRDLFYGSLADVFLPDLEKYELEDSIIKFTGDGILISIITPSKLINLICFALVVQNSFSNNLNKMMEISNDLFNWKLRIGISSGNDIVKDFFGKLDIIGDSIRKAVRTSTMCLENEILVSREVFDDTFREFEYSSIDLNNRFIELGKKPKLEQDVQILYLIKRIKVHSSNKDYSLKYLAAHEINDYETSNEIIKTSINDKELIRSVSNEGFLDLLASTKLTEDNLNFEILEKVRIENGIEKNIYYYNKLMSMEPSFDNSKQILIKLREDKMQPNEYTFNILMNKVNDYENAIQVLNAMKESNIIPDQVSYNTLMNKLSNFTNAKHVLKEMKEAGILPDTITFNTLMNKVSNFQNANQVLNEMKAVGILPDEISYTILMNKVTDFESAKKIYKQMKDEGLEPDTVAFNTLINKVKSLENAIQALEEMEDSKIKGNIYTYNILMNKVNSFEEAKKIFNKMNNNGIKADEYSFNILLNKVSNFNEGKEILEAMEFAMVEPDIVTFATLMNKTGNLNDGRKVLGLMVESGILPDLYTFNALINKSTDIKSCQKILNEMKEFGVNPTSITYGILLKKAPDLETAMLIMKQMQVEKISPDKINYTLLMNKANDFNNAKLILNEMISAGIKPDIVNYTVLFSKDIAQIPINEILEWYSNEEFHPIFPLEALMNQLYLNNKLENCFKIILNYPYLGKSKKILKELGPNSLKFLYELKNETYYPKNINYALGIYYFLMNNYIEAKNQLEIALKLSLNENRRNHIINMLNTINVNNETLSKYN